MLNVSFPKGFIWGAATAAYQIEGAAAQDGRGPCIWDTFSHIPGKTRDGDTGDMACDHYYRYNEDLDILKELGLTGYRFSIAWSRVLPEGRGRANKKGIDFYSRLIDGLLDRGIEPSATLYHWDLPQALQERGGWATRDIVDRFADYAALMFDHFADRVPRWYTHNEPWVVAYAGHFQGRHAPGITDLPTAVNVSHHLLLSHAKAVEAFRSAAKGEIGIVLNLYPTIPASESPSDTTAARLTDGFHNRWFLDPIYRGSYPADILDHLSTHGIKPDVREGDLAYIAAQHQDFLGINYYFRKIMKASETHPVFGFEEFKPQAATYTEMNWEVYAPGLYELLARLKADYGDLRMFITENGAAFPDTLTDRGEIEDEDRRFFLQEHFREAARAIADGIRLEGFFVWSLMDNFEWAQGYSKRFGLIGIDYTTQKRIWKKSARWYREIVKNNGF